MIDEYLMEEKNDAKRFADMLIKARSKSSRKLSQEDMAMILGVSKNTIYNIEKGTSELSVRKTFKWFTACGLNPWPYFLEYLYPDVSKRLEENDEIFIDIFRSLPAHTRKQLIFQYIGEHGSNPIAYQEKITADLLTPIEERNSSATVILNNYIKAEIKNELSECSEDVKPNIELFSSAIQESINAIRRGDKAYSMKSME